MATVSTVYWHLDERKEDWTTVSRRKQESITEFLKISKKDLREFVSDKNTEREDMQEKTFRKWLNAQLAKENHGAVKDVFRDLRDGRKLLSLLETLTGSKLPKEKGRTKVHAVNNINRALQVLLDANVKLVNINASDVADGNPKITLGLLWQIIQHYWRMYLQEEMVDFKQTSLEETLLRWCIYSTQRYEGIRVENFSSSWKDGLALNALIHNYRPELFNFEEIQALSENERLEHAFLIAEAHLGVEPLLDPEDVNSDHADRKSILTYVMCLFQALPHDVIYEADVQLRRRSKEEGGGGGKKSTAETRPEARRSRESGEIVLDERGLKHVVTDSEKKAREVLPADVPMAASGQTESASGSLQEYELCLEEVLTWLLDAEELLGSMEAINDADVDSVKSQFKDHEEFMLNLTRNQGTIGDALHQGNNLIQSGSLTTDETTAVQKQMGLLNEKWEKIREGSMKRQAKLQEKLMYLQQHELEHMSKWLIAMEDVINNAQPIGTDPDVVQKQTMEHETFQKKIEEKQKSVNSLANMVVVVDEARPAEKGYQDLESALKDIGKRWVALTQWAEKRTSRLNKLEQLLRTLSEEFNHFGDWLDLKEAALTSLKSAHHLSNTKEVLEQVENLQSMQQDLESEHPRFVNLNQVSSEAAAKLEYDNPVGAANIRRRLEEVSQRWENLVCRMEEHSSVLLRSGKLDPKKFKPPKLFTMTMDYLHEKDVVRRRTVYSSSVQKYLNVVARDPVDVRKKLKLEPTPESASFDVVLGDFCQWLDKTEAALALHCDDLEHKEQLIAYEQIESDVKARQVDLENLHVMGHHLTQQLTSENESTEEVEAQLHDVNSRWRDLRILLEERKRRLQIAVEAERFRQDLRQVDTAVAGLSAWVDSYDPSSISDVDNVRLGLRQCQDKLEIVKQQEPQVEALHARLEQLMELGGPDDSSVQKLQRDFDHFTEKWAHVVEKISGTLEVLTATIERTPAPSIEKALNSLNDWLHSAEDIIATQELDVIDHLHVTNAKIEKLKELQTEIPVQRENLTFVTMTAEELVAEKAEGSDSLSEQLMNLSPRWNDIERVVNSQLQRLHAGVKKLMDWDSRASELDRWIDQVTTFVHAEQPAIGTMDKLKEQLEQSQALSRDIETLKPKLDEMESWVKELATQSTTSLAEFMKQRMDELDQRWTDVVRLVKAKHDSLVDASTRSQKIYDETDQLTKWLNSVQEEVNQPAEPSSGKELQLLIKRYKQLKEELHSRSDTVEAAVCLGEEMAGSLSGSPDMTTQLYAQLNSTREQWTAICKHVREKLEALTNAFELWKMFQEFLAAEKICFDQLERKLGEPVGQAADAEEFSEQLDLLERLMEGGGGHERIVEIAKSLQSQRILSQAVEADMKKYMARREALMDPAKERQNYLDGVVHEAQQFEQQLLSCQSWIGHVDYILSARLESDILASDVPDEYKRALTQGITTLISQLQSEFDEHDACLERLESQVAVYRSNERREAAVRLQEQVEHIKKLLQDLHSKFERFKRPGDFQHRVDRLSHVLNDVEQGTYALRLSSDNAATVQQQYAKSQQISGALAEIKDELDYVIMTGTRMIDLQQAQKPELIEKRIQELQTRYSVLSSEVMLCKSTLEKASKIVKRIDTETGDLSAFLSMTEGELKKWKALDEATLRHESRYIQEVYANLCRRETTFVVIDEFARQWTSLVDSEVSQETVSRIEALRDRWKSITMCLQQLITDAQEETGSSDDLRQEFNDMVSDVNLWLDAAELTLSAVQSSNECSDIVVGDTLRKLHNEAVNLRPKMDQVRENGIHLMSEGEDTAKYVEHHVTSVSTRWETVVMLIEERQRELIGADVPEQMITTTTLSPIQEAGLIRPTVEEKPVSRVSEETQTSISQRPHAVIVREVSPEEIFASGAHAPLMEKILATNQALKNAENALLLRRPTTIEEWEKQLADAEAAMNAATASFAQVLKEGHALAESGPAELNIQRLLERIDDAAAGYKELERELKKLQEAQKDVLPDLRRWILQTETLIQRIEVTKQEVEQAGLTVASRNTLLAYHDELQTLRSLAAQLGQKLTNSLRQEPSHPPSAFIGGGGALESRLVELDKRLIELEKEFLTFQGSQHRLPTGAEQERSSALVEGVTELNTMLSSIETRLSQWQIGPLVNGDYAKQEETLKALKERIDAVQSNIDKLESSHRSVLRGTEDPEVRKMDAMMDTVKGRLEELKDAYEKSVQQFHSTVERWQTLQQNLQDLVTWVTAAETHVSDTKKTDGRLDLHQLEQTQKELESEYARKELALKSIRNTYNDLFHSSTQPRAVQLSEEIDAVGRRMQHVGVELKERRERLDDQLSKNSDLKEEIDELLFWMDETEALLTTYVDPSDHGAVTELAERFKERQNEFPMKLKHFEIIESAAQFYLESGQVVEPVKQHIRTDLQETEGRLEKLFQELKDKVRSTEENAHRCSHFWHRIKELSTWIRNAMTTLKEYHSAIIYTPTVDLSVLEKQISVKQSELDEISQMFAKLREEARLHEVQIGETTEETIRELLTDWSTMVNMVQMAQSASSSENSERDAVDKVTEMPLARERPEYARISKERKGSQRTSEHAEQPEIPPKGYAESAALAASSEHRPDDRRLVMSGIGGEEMQELTQLRHWLSDEQREHSGTIDVSEQKTIKENLKRQHNFLDQLQTKRLQLIKILERSRTSEVRHKAEILSRDWERCVGVVNRRKKELMTMLDDCRRWDDVKAVLEVWLTATEKTINGPKAAECDLEELQKEIAGVERLLPEVDLYKNKMTLLNDISHNLVEQYQNDDTTTVNQATSDLNTRWTKLNDNLRVRRAVLEASYRGRQDFKSAFQAFEQWLSRAEKMQEHLEIESYNGALLKNAAHRTTLMDKDKDLRAEIDAHTDVLRSLQENGATILTTLETSEERARMETHLAKMSERWETLLMRSSNVRKRLETAQEQWEQLTMQLQELTGWIEDTNRALFNEQPVGGDLKAVQKQLDFVLMLENETEKRNSRVNEVIKLTHSFLLHQDLRPKMYSPTGSEDEEEKDDPVKRNAKRVAQKIKNECDKLEAGWPELKDRVAKWKEIIETAFARMKGFDQTIQDCNESLDEMEKIRNQWIPVKDIQLDDLPNQMELAKVFRQNVKSTARHKLDDVNDQSSRLLADNVMISPELIHILEALNRRYRQIETAVAQRIAALQNALRDFGPSSQHFLQASVSPPWERAVSANRVPYYINHTTEKTQWDHPKMADIMDKLCEFNEVKFSAYRTAMKLRCLQKRLCLDLLNIHDAVAVFEQKRLRNVNDRVMDVSEMVMVLLPIYELLQREHPDLVRSVPFAIDLCLNYLLNVFDPARAGFIRVFAFKVALIVLCRAPLEEKYKFLFKQLATTNQTMDHKKLALLLHDCVQIPRFLGEVAAFGGTNIEPSVRSCFEKATFVREIAVPQFLDWLKCEPQSLVWLPVMHRVAASETQKHSAKCNVCKMFPIVGLRLRCLRCFNFDMCQNCFFSQRTAKSHKITHPMQEYCVASTSGEDVRDFGKVMKNKFKPKRYWKSHPRLGYLPVQSVSEGAPIQVLNAPPSNPATQELHNRIQEFTVRLADAEKSNPSAEHSGAEDTTYEDEHAVIANLTTSLAATDSLTPGDAPPAGPRSPAQILTLMESVQKEELNTMLKHLESENRRLMSEYEKLKGTLAASVVSASTTLQSTTSTPQLPMTNGSLGRRGVTNCSTGSLMHHAVPDTSLTDVDRAPAILPTNSGTASLRELSEEELVVEAKTLRQLKQRLEQRSRVLEDHNRQLEVQLRRLRQLIDEQHLSVTDVDILSKSATGFPLVPGASSKVHRGVFPLQNGHNGDVEEHKLNGEHRTESLAATSFSRMGHLMSTAQDLGRAMGSLVNAVTSDDEVTDDEMDESRISS